MLRSVCGTRAILPTSYTISSRLLNIDPEPFASGGYGDVYEGTLDGLRVCIKRVRVYTQDGPQKAARVRPRHPRSPRSPVLMKLADLLPRGHNVETLDTPEHRVPTWCYSHPLPARFELDVWWGLVGIHQKQL